MKSFFSGLLVLFFSVVLCALALEGFLKWYFRVPSDNYQQIITFESKVPPAKRLKPNLDVKLIGAYREFTYRLTTNAEGFRRSSLEGEGREKGYDIVLLGDSQTAGVGMEDSETIASYLAEKIRRPVLNTGCYGYSNLEESQLLDALLSQSAPKTVVLCFFAGNDPYENFTHLSSRGTASEPAPAKISLGGMKQYLVDRSALYNALVRLRRYPAVNRLFFKLKMVSDAPPSELAIFDRRSGQAAEFWGATAGVLRGMKAALDKRGVKMALLLIPDRYQVDSDYWNAWVEKYRLEPSRYDLSAPNQWLRRFCEENQIVFIDPTEALRESYGKSRSPYWRIDSHLNKTGNAIITEQLAVSLS